MQIKYNLKGISTISRILSKSELTYEEIRDIKDNAFLLRNRKNVSIEGKSLLTALEFKIRDALEKWEESKETKKLGNGSNQPKTGKFTTGKERNAAFRKIVKEHAEQGTPEEVVEGKNPVQDRANSTGEVQPDGRE